MSRSISSSRVVNRLDPARIRAALGGQNLIGREIVVCDETTSTNDFVCQLARGGAPEGVIVFAEYQTAGRGQRGNFWESAAREGLWFSVFLRPNLPVGESPRLTEWATSVIAMTIEARCLCKATIKPPNDILVAERKVAGVLVEMRAQENAPHLAIVGIGVNVNQQPHDFPAPLRERAGSLAMALGGPLDRNEFAIQLLRNLDLTYQNKVTLKSPQATPDKSPAKFPMV